MSTHKKDKRDNKASSNTTPSKAAVKADARSKLEAALAVPMMKTLAEYADEDILDLHSRIKEIYDLVNTRSLLLPRELRLAQKKKAFAATLAELEKSDNGVVDGSEEEAEEDDGDLLNSESEDDIGQEDGKVKEITDFFKKHLVLNDLVERENTVDGNEFMNEDDFDLEEGSEEDDEDDEEESEKVSKKVTKKGGVKIKELSSDEDAGEEDDESAEDEEMEEMGEEDEDDLAVSRQFFANFSLLDDHGKVIASNITLQCQDIYEGGGFEGEHFLAWNEDPIFSVNTVDGDIVEPDTPSFEELQAALEADEPIEDSLGYSLENTWDEAVADALKTKAGFKDDVTPVQFVILMIYVMSRIIKNAARTPGPGPADGLLPNILIQLPEHINAEDGEEGMDIDEAHEDEEDEEESSEEEIPAPKQKKPAAPAPAPAVTKKHEEKKNNKPHHDNKKPQHEGKKDHKPHPGGKKDAGKPQHEGKKPHHDNNKKPQHEGKKAHQQHHNKPQDQNNQKKFRPNPNAGDRPDQHKKHKKH